MLLLPSCEIDALFAIHTVVCMMISAETGTAELEKKAEEDFGLHARVLAAKNLPFAAEEEVRRMHSCTFTNPE